MVGNDESKKSALDHLREHYLAQEQEIAAAQLYRTSLWQAPSEQEFNENWIRPHEALEVSDLRFADEEDQWSIMQQLQAGQIIAVARTAQQRADLAGVDPLVPVPAGAWRRATPNDEHYFWKTGHLVVEARGTDQYGGSAPSGKERYFNIRFHPGSFDGRPPPVVDVPPQPSPPNPVQLRRVDASPPNRGGRPAKAFWDDLLIEIARRLYAGEFHPKRQAEVENAMHDWIAANGHSAGETQVRERARKLWQAIEK